MKRELKALKWEAYENATSSFKTDPDEKGTESCDYRVLSGISLWSFKTDPDEKGTESTNSWITPCSLNMFQD